MCSLVIIPGPLKAGTRYGIQSQAAPPGEIIPSITSDGVAVSQWYAGITTIRENWFYTEWVNEAQQGRILL